MTISKKAYRDQVARIAAARKSRQEKAFQRGLSKLRDYVKREKSADVPVMHMEGDYPLGRWVANQRAKYRRHETSKSDIRALESFPGWNWSAWDKDWPKAMRLLRAFQAREGHARCPANHIERGFALGAWVGRQRARYNAGRLSIERATELESVLDLTSNWKKTQSQELWETKLQALKDFAAENGHTQVPRLHMQDGHSLGIWVNSVRSQYNKGSLDAQRVASLEQIPGWEWARSRTEAKAHGYDRLLAYVKEQGHANVPRSFVDKEGVRLGEWVGKRRTAYKAGKLTDEEISQLEGLPGWAWVLRRRK